MKILISFLFLSLVSAAQTAKVIPLSASDAAQAKSLYDRQIALNKAKSDFEAIVKDKYLTKESDSILAATCATLALDGSGISYSSIPCPDPKAHKIKIPIDGWSNGFEYSEDFKYIVPKQPVYSLSGTGCTFLTPAIGTTTGKWNDLITAN